jgi:hypothetical protein
MEHAALQVDPSDCQSRLQIRPVYPGELEYNLLDLRDIQNQPEESSSSMVTPMFLMVFSVAHG